MIYTDSSGKSWRYIPRLAAEFQFTPEEHELFEEMQRAYDQNKVPQPTYEEDAATFLRFRSWQMWRLTQRYGPDFYPELFEPVEPEEGSR